MGFVVLGVVQFFGCVYIWVGGSSVRIVEVRFVGWCIQEVGEWNWQSDMLVFRFKLGFVMVIYLEICEERIQ